MPYFGPTIGLGQASNAAEYSHSTVFTVLHTDGLPTILADIAPLTTVYTPPSSCVDRYMIYGNLWSSAGTSMYNVYSIKDNPDERLYNECQPRNPVPDVYSPGVCPQGQTIAEVTVHQTQGPSGVMESYWQASCCPSNMDFGYALQVRCRSWHATPVQAFAYMTRFHSGSTGSETSYEYVTSSVVSTSNGAPVYSTSTMANMTMQTWGYVIADPIVVAWQDTDLSSFPTAYASSLANKVGIAFNTATPRASSSLPGATSSTTLNALPKGNTADSNTSLGLGAKLGISFGSVIAFVLLGSIIIIILRKQKRHRNMAQTAQSEDNPPQMQVLGELGESDAEPRGRLELEHTERLQPGLGFNSQAATLPIELAHQEISRAELDAKIDAARFLPIELDANSTSERKPGL